MNRSPCSRRNPDPVNARQKLIPHLFNAPSVPQNDIAEVRRGRMLLLLGLFGAGFGLTIVGFREESLMANAALFGLWGAAGTALISLERRTIGARRDLITMFWEAYSWRVLVVTALHLALSYTEQAPFWDFGAGGGDEFGFWQNSERFYVAWQEGRALSEQALEFSNEYIWLLALGFSRYVSATLGAESYFVAKLLLCMGTALVVPYIYTLCRIYATERVAKIAARIAFWLPDYFFYSGTIMRDALVSFVILFILYQGAQMMTGKISWWRIASLCVFNFVILRYLRADVTLVATGILFVYIIGGELGSHVALWKRLAGATLIFGLVALMLSILMPNTYSSGALATERLLSKEHIEHRLTSEREVGIEESSARSLGVRLLHLPTAIRIPVVAVYSIVEPFPPWRSLDYESFPLKWAIMAFCGIAWWVLLSFLPVGIWFCARHCLKGTIALWAPVCVFAALFGATANVHTRWRLMAVPFIVTVIALGIANYHRKVRLLHFTVVCQAGLIVAYMIIKTSM